MEENNTPKPNQVMDIQPPKQPEQQPQPQAVAAIDPQTEVGASQPVPIPSVEQTGASMTEVNEVQEAPQEQDMDVNSEVPATVPDTPALAAVAQPKEKSHKPILAVVSAVVVSGAFAALAVYAFLGSQEADTAKSTSQTSQQSAGQATKATASDVDNTSAAIDDSLKAIDDTTDYSDDAVSDTTLGL